MQKQQQSVAVIVVSCCLVPRRHDVPPRWRPPEGGSVAGVHVSVSAEQLVSQDLDGAPRHFRCFFLGLAPRTPRSSAPRLPDKRRARRARLRARADFWCKD